MLGCKFMITVTEREWTEQYLDFFKRHGAANVISKLCAGTSTDQMLNLWGLEKTDKVMYELVVRTENEQEIKNALHSEMNIGGAGVFYTDRQRRGRKRVKISRGRYARK